MISSIDIEQIDKSFLRSISIEIAWMYRCIPVSNENNKLIFYSDRKDLVQVQTELGIILNKEVSLEKADSNLIDFGLERFYRKSESARLNDLSNDAEFIQNLILEARALKSSDIHIEAGEFDARIRMRIDGKLIERYKLKKSTYPALINKIKIKAGLDISEKRLPQDGRFQIKVADSSIDIRVSITPTILAEKIVLRVLNKDKGNLDLNHIGMNPGQLLNFRKALQSHNGIILISGPTGSGKTSTLYASLNVLNTGDNNILTIEDPIEYTIEGINQVQVKESIGLGFAKALKSFLRQDPDIIMLGEIRDQDTANMAIRAALTGHLVFSTIHTNSAWSTISRLRDMGIPSFLIAGTVRMSIAQRLIRLLCENCKIKIELSDFKLPKKIQKTLEESSVYTSKGCKACYHTGFKGRKAIFEIIPINHVLQEEIRNEKNNERDIVKSNSIVTLSQEALDLVKTGQTSIEEIYPLILDQLN